MDSKQKQHLHQLQVRALLSLIAILAALISLFFAILLLFVPSYVSIICFVIFVLCTCCAICINYISKQESKRFSHKPITLNTDGALSFEKISSIFYELANGQNILTLSEEVSFYKIKNAFDARIVLYKTGSFDKKAFDSAKNRINQKANTSLNISQWVSRDLARNMMRFNIICVDDMNDQLLHLMCANSAHNLRRTEGVMNIAICDSDVIIPPLFGDCSLLEINRYKKSIKFISQYLVASSRPA